MFELGTRMGRFWWLLWLTAVTHGRREEGAGRGEEDVA